MKPKTENYIEYTKDGKIKECIDQIKINKLKELNKTEEYNKDKYFDYMANKYIINKIIFRLVGIFILILLYFSYIGFKELNEKGLIYTTESLSEIALVTMLFFILSMLYINSIVFLIALNLIICGFDLIK